jgi:hypothetical protein
MVNAHYVIIDFRAKFFIKIQNQASDTSCSFPSFSSAPFLLRAVPSERLGQVYLCVCELDLYVEGKDGNFISYHLLLLTQRRGWLMNNCSEQFPFYQRS